MPPVGPSEDELREITAAANVLKNALTPLPKPPSGTTLSPEIEKLINDASRILVSVVGGQTETQRIPEPAPGEADDPRLPPTGTQTGGGRCQQNWQHYEDMEENVTWNGQKGDRATGAMACVVTVNQTKRPPKLKVDPFGRDSSKGMARCHLIGHKLNGSNTNPANFVPCYQDPANNSWMYHNVEAKIQHQVEDLHNPVLMAVKPIYSGKNPVPVSIEVAAVGEDGWWCLASIPNLNRQGAVGNGVTTRGDC